MSARRLGRLLGSVLMLAALVGGIYAGGLGTTDTTTADGTTDTTTTGNYDWTGRFGQLTVDTPAAGISALLGGDL